MENPPTQDRSRQPLLDITDGARLSAVTPPGEQTPVHLDRNLQIDVGQVKAPAADRIALIVERENVFAHRHRQAHKLELGAKRVSMINLEAHGEITSGTRRSKPATRNTRIVPKPKDDDQKRDQTPAIPKGSRNGEDPNPATARDREQANFMTRKRGSIRFPLSPDGDDR